MMLQLIRKDILFNWKWALLLVLVAVLMPLVFYIDREETRLILWVYIIGSVLANSHFVSKSCYLDDGAQTRRFLASLPVKKSQLVFSKYLLGLLCMAVTLLLTTLSSFALGFHPSACGVMIAAAYLFLYYAAYLGVFYRSNYSRAEKTGTAFMMLTVMSAFVIDRSGGRLDEMAVSTVVLAVGLGICALIYAVSLYLSIRFSSGFLNGKAG